MIFPHKMPILIIPLWVKCLDRYAAAGDDGSFDSFGGLTGLKARTEGTSKSMGESNRFLY
jgi:hypothetical protein